MDPFKRYFTLNQKLLSIGGLWYTQSHKERLLRYCVIGFMSLYSVFGEVCQILTLNLDLQSAVRSLQVFIPAICVAVVYSTAILHYATLRKLYLCIQEDWQRLRNDTEHKIMQKYAHITKFSTLCVASIFYLYLLISLFSPLRRVIIFTAEVRRDIDHYPIISCIDYFLDQQSYHYTLVMSQITATLVVMSIAVSCYSMYFSFIQHACACLSIIKYKIRFPLINDDYNSRTTTVDLTHWLIDILQDLARTKEFMMLVNRTTEKCYLLQVLLAFILFIIDFLCIFQIPTLLQQNHRGDVLELILFILATSFVVYIYCYMGQRLMDCSTDVYREACLVPIYKISLKTQKLLLMTLMISAKPCTFSVYKVDVLSHEFFSRILRSALSFATILRSIQKM